MGICKIQKLCQLTTQESESVSAHHNKIQRILTKFREFWRNSRNFDKILWILSKFSEFCCHIFWEGPFPTQNLLHHCQADPCLWLLWCIPLLEASHVAQGCASWLDVQGGGSCGHDLSDAYFQIKQWRIGLGTLSQTPSWEVESTDATSTQSWKVVTLGERKWSELEPSELCWWLWHFKVCVCVLALIVRSFCIIFC